MPQTRDAPILSAGIDVAANWVASYTKPAGATARVIKRLAILNSFSMGLLY